MVFCYFVDFYVFFYLFWWAFLCSCVVRKYFQSESSHITFVFHCFLLWHSLDVTGLDVRLSQWIANYRRVTKLYYHNFIARRVSEMRRWSEEGHSPWWSDEHANLSRTLLVESTGFSEEMKVWGTMTWQSHQPSVIVNPKFKPFASQSWQCRQCVPDQLL